MKDSLLNIDNVHRVFGRGDSAVHALKGVHMKITEGQLIALKGRSGSGKTTLINMLGALDRPTEGSILFRQNDITTMNDKQRIQLRKNNIGFVFQSYGLVSLMTAYENVEFGLRVAGVPNRLHKQRVLDVLEFVGMTKRQHHRPFELSGGEQQRVAIARAIAHRPQLILADEPTANLDSKMSLQVMKVFRDLVSAEGITIIMTTHDQAVLDIVDHVFELEDGKIGI